MGPNTRGTNPEDEYFARREGEIERERDERGRRERELGDERARAAALPEKREEKKGGSRIVDAVSTAMKAMFGIRGNRHRHA